VSEMSAVIQVELPSGDELAIIRWRFGCGGPGVPRVAIVAGIRGDAPEGIRVAHQVARALEKLEDRLTGLVDVYPCANPLGAHQGSRLWPFFDVDLNRLFPGNEHGHQPDRVAHALCNDVRGATQVVELRGAREAFSEVIHAQVRERDVASAELALGANAALVWARKPGPAATRTFAHQFPGSIVLEGGTGNRLTSGVGKELEEGVIHLLTQVGVLAEADLPFHWAALNRPVIVTDDQVFRVRAERSGLFLPEFGVWSEVGEGAVLGTVIDPESGGVLESILSPCAGRVMAVREHPVVYPGTMVARVVIV
jgi:predicted deacylase